MSLLSFEKCYLATSVFFDTALRVSKKFDQFKNIDIEKEDIENFFLNSFQHEISSADLSISLNLRQDLFNNILLSQKKDKLEFDKIEIKRVNLKNLKIKLNSNLYYRKILIKFFFGLSKRFYYYSKFLLKILFSHNKRPSAGFINLNYLYINNLYNYNFFKLDTNIKNKTLKLENIKKDIYLRSNKKFTQELELLIKKNSDFNNFSIELFSKYLLIFLINYTEVALLNYFDVKSKINDLIIYFKKNNLKFILSKGGFFRFENIIVSIAARKNNIPSIEIQNGGSVFYKIGKCFDKDSNELKFCDYNLLWGEPQLKNNSKLSNKIKIPDAHLYLNKNSYKKRYKINSKKLKILYSPMSLTHLFNIENWLSINTTDLIEHRKWEKEIWTLIDQQNFSKNIKLYIKIKNFGNNLFKNFENLVFPIFNFKNIQVEYLSNGISSDYFENVDIHIFTGPSTSLAESINCGIPSICLFDSNSFILSNQYIQFFNKLKDADIISDNSFDLKDKIKFYIDNKLKLKDFARYEELCEEYAYTNNKPFETLNKTLNKILFPN
tara:strand:- start:39538 stop:41190 length:1653 start_codon:yes stop_codon:yes gene_type:complete